MVNYFNVSDIDVDVNKVLGIIINRYENQKEHLNIVSETILDSQVVISG